jgi:hypothetical protein
VQSGRALFGAWVPLVYASGTAIVMAESSGRVAEWHAGAKWAIWDLFTFSVLAASIVLFLAYLAAREAHRLHVWRGAPGGPLQGSVVEDGAARPRLTLGGWALVLVLAGGLSVGTAALAPYLWRTAPADDGGGSSGGGGAGGSGSAGSGSGGPGPGSGGGDGLRRRGRTERPMGTPTEEMQRNLQPLRSAGVDPLATLVTLLILGLLGLLLGGPPARRLLLERRLRAPPWSVPPARRVQELWALVALVLADLGVPAREGEPAEAHVARARAALGALPSTDAEIAGLAEAAAIADRVRFGLGMAPGDVGAMERAACWAADTAWERLGERAQLRALYRWG